MKMTESNGMRELPSSADCAADPFQDAFVESGGIASVAKVFSATQPGSPLLIPLLAILRRIIQNDNNNTRKDAILATGIIGHLPEHLTVLLGTNPDGSSESDSFDAIDFVHVLLVHSQGEGT